MKRRLVFSLVFSVAFYFAAGALVVAGWKGLDHGNDGVFLFLGGICFGMFLCLFWPILVGHPSKGPRSTREQL